MPVTSRPVRVPPSNQDAEQAVLGAILSNSSALNRVIGVLTPEDFYNPGHGEIFGAILELFEKRKPVDILGITGYLRDRKILGQVGGAGYLAELTTTYISPDTIEQYAQMIKEKRVLRDLIRASHSLIEKAYDSTSEYEDVVEEAQGNIFSLFSKSTTSKLQKVSDGMKEASVRIAKLREHGDRLRGVPTGFNRLDNILSGLQKSDLIILGARPSLGKTSMALDVARHAAHQGVVVGICSLEMSRDQVIDRIISAEARVPLWSLRSGKIYSEDVPKVERAIEESAKLPILIDDSAAPTITQIRAIARRIQMEYGLGLLVVDYLQLIHPSRHIDSMVAQVTEVSRGLKAIARDLQIPVLALSQLSRGVDQREDKTPRLSDLRESGAIEQDADVVLLLSRKLKVEKDEENVAKLFVAKHRNGPLGDVDFVFNGELASFSELDYSHIPGFDDDAKS